MSAVLPNPALVAPGPIAPVQPTAPAQPPRRRAGAVRARRSRRCWPSTRARRTFSRHALQRLQQRGITLDQSTLGRLTDGVSRAASKGSRDSVVFVDGTAYVVSVANNTVITAVGSEHMRQQVFTNIDSAVIA